MTLDCNVCDVIIERPQAHFENDCFLVIAYFSHFKASSYVKNKFATSFFDNSQIKWLQSLSCDKKSRRMLSFCVFTFQGLFQSSYVEVS